MPFADTLVLVRGGGDLATGVVARLTRAGFPVVISELENPLTVRRTVSFSTAVSAGSITVEGIEAVHAEIDQVDETIADGRVPVLVCASFPKLTRSPIVVVDARLAKRNIDTSRDDAPLVIALGPGFTAGADCDAVIETARGHRLGRVIWEGEPQPDTGTPGIIDGRGRDRVLRAPTDGRVKWVVEIGSEVDADEVIGTIGSTVVKAPFVGMVRGLIATDSRVSKGLKIGDVDPRVDPEACFEISDKALAVGGGVVEAVLLWLNQSS